VDAGQFQAAALAAIETVRARGKWALLVGGTGQYIRAITEGWQVPPGEPSRELRAQLEATLARDGVGALAARLREVDPESAAGVDLRNPRRVIRALEVALTTGESFVAQRRRAAPPVDCLTIGLTRPRPELYARIDARVDAMLRAGLVEEVRGLVAKGYDWDLPAMSALGYKQIGQYLRGECDMPEAARRIKSATRQFVPGRPAGSTVRPGDRCDVARVGVEEIEAYSRRTANLPTGRLLKQTTYNQPSRILRIIPTIETFMTAQVFVLTTSDRDQGHRGPVVLRRLRQSHAQRSTV
jgi:hypothetical protein